MTNSVDLKLLSDLLALPSIAHREFSVIAFLIAYCSKKGWRWHVDTHGNLYVNNSQPGFSPEAFTVGGAGAMYCPCLAAHMDTVHSPELVRIEKKNNRLIAIGQDEHQTGLGGDDKAGIYVCLELLNRLSGLKAAFFVAEEIGCQGSRVCDEQFFNDVGYVMEWDSPCDDIMTYTCDGTQLFPDEGEFHDTMLPIVKRFGVINWQHHPYTDVSVLRRKFDFPCLNLPPGYFRMHSAHEYVSVPAVENALNLGAMLIQELGHRYYLYEASVERDYGHAGRPALPVSGLKTHG